MEATDTECKVSRTQAPAGAVEFTVTNKGSKVNEFYIYGEGGRVMGELENITPGLSRSFRSSSPSRAPTRPPASPA